MIERIPPQGADLEMCVLGAVMIEPAALEVARTIIRPDDFYLSGHGTIYRLMLELADRGIAPDFNTVFDELRARAIPEHVYGGMGVLMGMLNSVPTASGVEDHARKVKEKSLLRQLIRSCDTATAACYLGQQTPDEILFSLNRDLDAVADGTAGEAEIETVEELARQVAAELIEQYNAGDTRSGATTGWDSLDRLCGGYQRGDLVIWCAPTNTGKSKLLCYSLIQTALAGNTAGLISIDMNRRRLAKYLLPPVLTLMGRNVAPESIFDPVTWNERGEAMIRDECFSVDLGGRLLAVPKPRSTSLMAIEGYVRKLARMGCHVIAIDQAQNFSEYRADEHGDIANIVGRVKHWAWHYNVCIVLVHQVNREAYTGRFNLKNLQGSSAFEQYSDTVISLNDPQQRMLDMFGEFVDEGMGRYRKVKDEDRKEDSEASIKDAVENPRPVELNLAKSREDMKKVLETKFDYRLGVVTR